jgi:hypothetical protein
MHVYFELYDLGLANLETSGPHIQLLCESVDSESSIERFLVARALFKAVI